MKFSINATLYKRLSLILALVMVLALFAGCKKDTPPTEPEETPGLNINLTDATTPEASDETTPTTDPTEPNENMATVTSRMNVRARAAVDAVIVATLEAGDRIEITRQQYSVGYNWGYTPSVEGGGWVIMDFVEMDNPTGTTSTSNQTPAQMDPSLAPTEETKPTNTSTEKIRATITATELKIRSEGSQNGKILGTYKKGETVTILETANGWGRTADGWISMTYVSTSGQTSNNTSSNNNSSTNNNTSSATIESNGSTKVISRGIVKAGELNLRSKPSQSGEKLGTLKYGARVEILQTSGNWGRTEKGWVSMSYVYKDGTTGTNTDYGTVTADKLTIRTGPGTEYGTNGSYYEGDNVTILEMFKYGNTTWGCTNKGWISLSYVDLDGGNDDVISAGDTAWVTARELNIREGAGSNYDTTGDTYLEGDKVTILETDGNWGRTDKGWISLSYVTYDEDDFDDDSDDVVGTGTVTATRLMIRSGAGTGYREVGSYLYGDEITILESEDGWGRTSKGWVSLDYVDMD